MCSGAVFNDLSIQWGCMDSCLRASKGKREQEEYLEQKNCIVGLGLFRGYVGKKKTK